MQVSDDDSGFIFAVLYCRCCTPAHTDCTLTSSLLCCVAVAAPLQDMMADLSELFDDIGIDPLLFFMMSGLFGGRRGGGMPFGGMGGMRGGMGGMMGGRRGPVVFMSSGGPAMYYAGALSHCCGRDAEQ